MVVLLGACGGSSSAGSPDSSGSATVPGTVLERTSSRNHTQGPVDYKGKKPPSGGDHYPVPLTCGAYSQQPRDEYAVHSLEHGAVWIAYRPDLDQASIAKLRQHANQPKVIVSPYDGLNTPIVIVAWEHRLELQSGDDPRVQQFIDTYGNGKVAPEPNAACVGTGQPGPL
jgi:hypothetical protein